MKARLLKTLMYSPSLGELIPRDEYMGSEWHQRDLYDQDERGRVYLKKGTIMTTDDPEGEWEGGGHTCSLDPTWYGVISEESTSLSEGKRVKAVVDTVDINGMQKFNIKKGALLDVVDEIGPLYIVVPVGMKPWLVKLEFGRLPVIKRSEVVEVGGKRSVLKLGKGMREIPSNSEPEESKIEEAIDQLVEVSQHRPLYRWPAGILKQQIIRKVIAHQREEIQDEYGEDAADKANYGWAASPGNYVTKVYVEPTMLLSTDFDEKTGEIGRESWEEY